MAETERVEGITADYVWYQSKLLTNKMNEWQLDFDKVVGVMEARHKEHLKIIGELLDEIKELKKDEPWVKTYSGGKPNYTQPEPTVDGWPLYSGLPEPKWVGLSDAEIGEIYRAGWSNNMDFARALEAKLKEKNNG
jgi:hypothetical protein